MRGHEYDRPQTAAIFARDSRAIGSAGAPQRCGMQYFSIRYTERLVGAGIEGVEFATREGAAWFNNRRLPEPIGYVPPAEAEAQYCAAQENLALEA